MVVKLDKPITEELYNETKETNFYLTDEQKKRVFNEYELSCGIFGALAVKTGFHTYSVHAYMRDKTATERPVKDDTELKERQISFDDLENPFERGGRI